jgi:glycosyltransferase involved in cell wall biosynthesis
MEAVRADAYGMESEGVGAGRRSCCGEAARPRVLRVTTRLNIGGPARQTIYLTDELRRRGFDTRLVWGSSGPNEGTLPPPAHVPNTQVPWLGREVRPVDDLRAALTLSSIVRRWHPDIVHTHLAKAGALGRSVAFRAHVPVVVHTFHGHVLQDYFSNLKTNAFAKVERALAARSDALIAVATEVRDELLARGIGTEDRWHVIPVGVDLAPFLEDRPRRDHARLMLDVPHGAPVVGIVGRLAPVKDHRTFLRAASRIAERRPDALFLVAGDGEDRAALEDEARQTLGDRVRFLGWVNDLPTLYAACDVVALTSRAEGTPVALIEAAAARRPAVATRVGGVPAVVLDGVTGRTVNAGDDVAVADALMSLLDDPDLARAMGESGADHVRARFSRQRMADDLTELYRDLLGISTGTGIRSSSASSTPHVSATPAPSASTTP